MTAGTWPLTKADWICLQCGVYYYTGLYNGAQRQGDGLVRIAPVSPGKGASGRRASAWEAR